VTVGPAEVFDLGYRPYEGERRSRWHRRRAIWRDGMRIALGLGRGAGAKVTPWVLIALALAPVVVLIVIASLAASLGGDSADADLPSYAEYYEFAIIPLALFAALVGPLLLCPDRRAGVLSLYAARPITAVDYVGARWAAFLTVSLGVVWVPEALLFGWNALEASSLGSFLADEWDVVPRFLAAGAVLAVVLTTLALLAASFTSRRGHAAVATLAVLFVGSFIGGFAEGSFSGPIADAVSLVSLPQALTDGIRWIFDDELSDRPVSGSLVVLWLVALGAALAVGLLVQTRRLMRA
jgi:ABC-2 type transport system permease protein